MDDWMIGLMDDWIALGSCGEFHSSICCFKEANQLTEEDYDKLDIIHYKTENELIKLIISLQNKLKNGEWNETLE